VGPRQRISIFPSAPEASAAAKADAAAAAAVAAEPGLLPPGDAATAAAAGDGEEEVGGEGGGGAFKRRKIKEEAQPSGISGSGCWEASVPAEGEPLPPPPPPLLQPLLPLLQPPLICSAVNAGEGKKETASSCMGALVAFSRVASSSTASPTCLCCAEVCRVGWTAGGGSKGVRKRECGRLAWAPTSSSAAAVSIAHTHTQQ
jgi:hypothetical protein